MERLHDLGAVAPSAAKQKINKHWLPPPPHRPRLPPPPHPAPAFPPGFPPSLPLCFLLPCGRFSSGSAPLSFSAPWAQGEQGCLWVGPHPCGSSIPIRPLWEAPVPSCDGIPCPGINRLSNAISLVSPLLPCSPANKVVLLSLPFLSW